jgi:hypothetical protein
MSGDTTPDYPEVEPVDVEPADEVHRHRHPCPHCGGENFARGLMLHQFVSGSKASSLGHYLGIQYWITRPGKEFITYQKLGVEPLHATICKDCGTVVRIYVVETDRDWTRWQRRGDQPGTSG